MKNTVCLTNKMWPLRGPDLLPGGYYTAALGLDRVLISYMLATTNRPLRVHDPLAGGYYTLVLEGS